VGERFENLSPDGEKGGEEREKTGRGGVGKSVPRGVGCEGTAAHLFITFRELFIRNWELKITGGGERGGKKEGY